MRISNQSSRNTIVLGVIGGWTILYLVRGLAAHYSFETNAYDLSLLDHAIWSLTHGGRGEVSFIGQSIFSQHFMPILAAIVPLYAIAPSPVTLIFLQVLAIGGAAWLYVRLQRHIGLESRVVTLMVATLLFARRTHSATTSVFYPESLQPLLTLACVLMWREQRWKSYWACAIALLMTKEDAAIYLGTFAALMWLVQRTERRRAAMTLVLCVVWAIAALQVAIPISRAADGLPAANPLFADRFGVSRGGVLDAEALVDRAMSPHTASTVFNLMAAAGFLPFAAAEWLLPALPAAAINLLARPDAMQSALIGHYFFPVMPWLFLAAAHGVARAQRRFPRAALVWCVILVAATLIDSPAFRRMPMTMFSSEVRTAREQLQQISGDVILVQPNLVPHLPHRPGLYTLGEGATPPRAADMVAMISIGDRWPFSPAEWDRQLEAFRKNPDYQEVLSGPVFAFKHR